MVCVQNSSFVWRSDTHPGICRHWWGPRGNQACRSGSEGRWWGYGTVHTRCRSHTCCGRCTGRLRMKKHIREGFTAETNTRWNKQGLLLLMNWDKMRKLCQHTVTIFIRLQVTWLFHSCVTQSYKQCCCLFAFSSLCLLCHIVLNNYWIWTAFKELYI